VQSIKTAPGKLQQLAAKGGEVALGLFTRQKDVPIAPLPLPTTIKSTEEQILEQYEIENAISEVKNWHSIWSSDKLPYNVENAVQAGNVSPIFNAFCEEEKSASYLGSTTNLKANKDTFLIAIANRGTPEAKKNIAYQLTRFDNRDYFNWFYEHHKEECNNLLKTLDQP
jgi:hypothetical protein